MASMAPRYTVHPEHTLVFVPDKTKIPPFPEHIRSLPSMAPRFTVHPEHKKAKHIAWPLSIPMGFT